MIIVKVYGGLAGQMMQYAFACFLEHKRHEEVKLDISFFSGQSHNKSFRKFELLNWNTKFNLVKDIDYESVFSDLSFSDKLKFKILAKEIKNKANFYETKHFCYDESVLNPKYKIFDGYWVNNIYMSNVSNRLKEDFTPRYPASEVNRDMLDKMQSTESVSIHFRRGDYIGSVHDVLKMDYYSKAIGYIRGKIENPFFFVFSDDIEYVKQNYDLGQCLYIDHNKGEESYWDIFLMSNCRHNIIANSGFSFWGAWLNTNKSPLIIAPSNWMQTENKISQNLLMPNWHII